MAEMVLVTGGRHTTEKARRVLGWAPRPARETVLDCARSLIAHGAV
jgi:dihydroflavonol-4-reductase